MTFLNDLYGEIRKELEEKGSINITQFKKQKMAYYVLKRHVPGDMFVKGLGFVVQQLVREGIAEKKRKGREWILRKKEVVAVEA